MYFVRKDFNYWMQFFFQRVKFSETIFYWMFKNVVGWEFNHLAKNLFINRSSIYYFKVYYHKSFFIFYLLSKIVSKIIHRHVYKSLSILISRLILFKFFRYHVGIRRMLLHCGDHHLVYMDWSVSWIFIWFVYNIKLVFKIK